MSRQATDGSRSESKSRPGKPRYKHARGGIGSEVRERVGVRVRVRVRVRRERCWVTFYEQEAARRGEMAQVMMTG